MKHNPYIALLCEKPDFIEAVKEIAERAPVVPLHNPEKDNTELWKAKSAERKGFEYCLSQFGFKLEKKL